MMSPRNNLLYHKSLPKDYSNPWADFSQVGPHILRTPATPAPVT
jgi:hypothetical protein